MKLRIILISAMLTALLSISSCIKLRQINVEISCDQFAQNSQARNEFRLKIGDSIKAKLCSNPTTGFQWKYETSQDIVLKELNHDFEQPQGDVVGAAGTEVWTFLANEKGTTEVRMEYSQPWEGGKKAEWTYTMTVTVE